MKTTISLVTLFLSVTSLASAAERELSLPRGPLSRRRAESSSHSSYSKSSKNSGSSSNDDGDCGSCPFDVFYHYETKTDFRKAFFDAPGDCVLAAIRDDESLRGAQYAIPDDKIALTQGYFEIDHYLDECHLDDSKSTDGVVTGCEDHYNEYFVNYEGSHVVDDDDCWVDVNSVLDDGLLHVAIGSDGLLRPVKSWSKDVDEFGFDGAVYECCPRETDFCEILKVAESS